MSESKSEKHDRNGSMAGVFRKISAGHVIGFFVMALLSTVLWIGSGYAARLESLEESDRERDRVLDRLLDSTEHMRKTVDEIRVTQKMICDRQTEMKIDVELIKRKVGD